MKSTTTPWLLALMMAMLPRNSHAANRSPPFQSLMMISSYAGRRRQTAFLQLQRSNHYPLHSMMKTKLHNDILNKFNPSSKTTRSETCVSTRIAMSSSPLSSSSQRTSPSPWSPGKWKITLDFGKEELNNSFERNENSQQLANVLGEDWGSNSGRLVLSFDVMANAETNTKAESNANSVQMAWLGGKPTGTVECIPQQLTNSEDEYYCASYITEKGQQTVQISPGQWRIEPPLPLLPSYVNILPGQASTLRFHLTLRDPIRRNTIHFPQNQMLLLQSNTFRAEQYASGARTLLPYQYAKDASQKQLEEQLNHETGDRRLDGNDIFETLGGYKDVAELVLERDEKRRKWKEIEGALPKLLDSNSNSMDVGRKVDINKLLEDEKRWGVWPGDTEFMTMERGVVLAVVAKESKQKMGLFSWMQDGGGVEEPVVVGTWSAVPDIN